MAKIEPASNQPPRRDRTKPSSGGRPPGTGTPGPVLKVMSGHEVSATRPVHPAQHMLAQSTWICECRPSLSRFPGVHGCGHVSRGTPVRITDRDSAGHPFPARELIVVSSGLSRCWSVRGSPVPRGITGHAALVQVFNPVRQPARHRRDQNHRSRNRPNPTSQRGHVPTAPAGPVLQQHSTRIAIAATSLPPIPMPPPPRDSIPSTP